MIAATTAVRMDDADSPSSGCTLRQPRRSAKMQAVALLAGFVRQTWPPRLKVFRELTCIMATPICFCYRVAQTAV